MIGIPLDRPTNIFCDNEAIDRNLTMPESTSQKKHVAIYYHCLQGACALGMLQSAKEDGATNLAALMTMSLPGPQFRDISGWILY